MCQTNAILSSFFLSSDANFSNDFGWSLYWTSIIAPNTCVSRFAYQAKKKNAMKIKNINKMPCAHRPHRHKALIIEIEKSHRNDELKFWADYSWMRRPRTNRLYSNFTTSNIRAANKSKVFLDAFVRCSKNGVCIIRWIVVSVKWVIYSFELIFSLSEIESRTIAVAQIGIQTIIAEFPFRMQFFNLNSKIAVQVLGWWNGHGHI